MPFIVDIACGFRRTRNGHHRQRVSLSVYSLPLLKTLDLVGCRGIARVLDPPLLNAVVVASVAQCFEYPDADEEDGY